MAKATAAKITPAPVVVKEEAPKKQGPDESEKPGRTEDGLQEESVTFTPTIEVGQPTPDTKVAVSAGGPLREPATLGTYGSVPTNADLGNVDGKIEGTGKEVYRAADENDLNANESLKGQNEELQGQALKQANNGEGSIEAADAGGATVVREETKDVSKDADLKKGE